MNPVSKKLMFCVDVVLLNLEMCCVSEHCSASGGAEAADWAQGSRGEMAQAAASPC